MREAEIEAEVAAVEAGQRVCAIEGCPLRALSVHHVGDEGAWRMVVAVCWYHGEEHIWSGSVGVRQRGAHSHQGKDDPGALLWHDKEVQDLVESKEAPE